MRVIYVKVHQLVIYEQVLVDEWVTAFQVVFIEVGEVGDEAGEEI